MNTKIKKLKLNRALLREMKATILKKPGQFQMACFFSSRDSTEHPATGCGTAACLAGWALAIKHAGGRPGNAYGYIDTDADGFCNTWETGRRLLRLTDRQAQRFFALDGWPAGLQTQYYKAVEARDAMGAARAAGRRIDHLLKTGK